MFRDQGGLFSYVLPGSRVATGHPLRTIQELVRDVLKELSPTLSRLHGMGDHQCRSSCSAWFVRLPSTTFTRNRERLQASEVLEKRMTRLINRPQVKPLRTSTSWRNSL